MCFVLGLHLMTLARSARRGNQLSAAGMVLAVATTLAVLIHDRAINGVGRDHAGRRSARRRPRRGLVTARRVKMTAMPQLVSLFNAVGGGAAALIAIGDAIKHAGSVPLTDLPLSTTLVHRRSTCSSAASPSPAHWSPARQARGH